jgi:hypothetical protein
LIHTHGWSPGDLSTGTRIGAGKWLGLREAAGDRSWRQDLFAKTCLPRPVRQDP